MKAWDGEVAGVVGRIGDAEVVQGGTVALGEVNTFKLVALRRKRVPKLVLGNHTIL